MTSRERYINTIEGKPIDRFVRTELGPWPSTLERWINEGLPTDQDFMEHFEMDPMMILPIKSGYTESPYLPTFEPEVLEETEEHVVRVDPDGITKKVLKSRTDTSMPQFLKFPVASRQDWEKIRERLDPGDTTKRIGEPKFLTEQCSDPNVPTVLPICGAYGHPRNLLGAEGLSYVLFDDPDLLHEILENWCELYIELIRQLTAIIRIDGIVMWEDMCYKNGPLINPAHFRTFMLPRYKSFIQAAKACGVSGIAVDSDGDVREMIPIFLEAGVNVMLPFEVQAGLDVVKIREQFGDSFVIMGGIDKRALARDKKSIKAEVDRVVPYFIERGRYVPCLDHAVPTDVSLDNFTYYLQCLRSYEKG